EVQRREVRLRTLERPGAAIERHRVEPRGAAGVEVVLDVPAVIPRDDNAIAVGGVRSGHRRPLDEDPAHGLEHDLPADIGGTGQVDGELPLAREITQHTDSHVAHLSNWRWPSKVKLSGTV